MSPTIVFQIHLVLGYVAWLPCFGTYLWPRLTQMNPAHAQRALATLHGFRFFGLVFIVPGVVGPDLPTGFSALPPTAIWRPACWPCWRWRPSGSRACSGSW